MKAALYGYEGENWVCYFWRNNAAISLGISICWKNVEIHVPLGFLRIGMRNEINATWAIGWHWGEWDLATTRPLRMIDKLQRDIAGRQ